MNTGKEDGRGLRAMRVNDLRWRAHQNEMDVDGSRETLVAAIKKWFEKN